MTIVYSFIFLFISVCQCGVAPSVKTPLGKVKGTHQISHGGRTYSAFEGIPFAIPPIGERRFEEPEPIEPWTGVWNATFPTQCLQTTLPLFSRNGNSQFDEDCLHINVYVPHEVPNPDEKLEVIVHIHGGAYLYGAGHQYANPHFLMDHDIIFVTFNYRLGILGFLSTEDDVVPGNNGLKDQVLALKWVQKNIASFGGNPDSVTLTGLSAGASSVHFHYFSEMSKGLFHRGLSQSGVALNCWSIQDQPLQKAKILAQAVGCPTSTTRSLVHCLKQRPHQHLLAQMPLFFGYNYFPFVPLAPVVEKGSKPFLTADPYYLLTQKKVLDVPWISSNTLHEGLFPILFFQNELDTVDKKWDDVAPFLLDFNHTLPKSSWKEVSKKIKEFYMGKGQSINQENLFMLAQMFGDRWFLSDAETAVREQARVTKSPVHYYLFGYPGDNNEHGTVSHGVDGKYIFGDFFTHQTLTPNEIKMKDIMVEMLVSYAKTGKPSVPGVSWEPTGHKEFTYLAINGYDPEHIKLEKVEELTPRKFWNSLKFKENANLIFNKDEL